MVQRIQQLSNCRVHIERTSKEVGWGAPGGLVVSQCFSYIGNVIIPTVSYFSEGLVGIPPAKLVEISESSLDEFMEVESTYVWWKLGNLNTKKARTFRDLTTPILGWLLRCHKNDDIFRYDHSTGRADYTMSICKFWIALSTFVLS